MFLLPIFNPGSFYLFNLRDGRLRIGAEKQMAIYKKEFGHGLTIDNFRSGVYRCSDGPSS
jgi:hypothetical protein